MRAGRIRKSLKDKIPTSLGIPKFFGSADLEHLVRVKREDPHLSWQEAIDKVVFHSIPDIRTLVSR